MASASKPLAFIKSTVDSGAVIVPSFSSEFDKSPAQHDKAAYAAYVKIFKDRKVIQVPTRELLLGGGGIHCVTQQVPKQK